MNDVVKSQGTEVGQVARARGLENQTDSSDLILPRAKKIEAMSPEMKDMDLVKSGVMPGKIINSITKEVLPEIFVPIIFFKTWIRFNSNKPGDRGWVDGFGPRDVVYICQDPNDQRVKADSVWDGDLPPVATTFLNFLSIFEGQDCPVVVSFGGTNFKAGKTLLSLAKFKGGDLFSSRYKLKTKSMKNDKGEWFVLDVAFAGKATDEEYKKAEVLYNSFAKKEVKVHTEETESEPF